MVSNAAGLASAEPAEQFLKKEEAERERSGAGGRRFQALSARLVRDEGLRLCDEGDVGRGLLALVHALEIALRRRTRPTCGVAIRTNLAAAEKRVHPLKALLSHEGMVLAVAWSLDGMTVVTGGHDKTARVWD